jgi:prefoldin subunit 5
MQNTDMTRLNPDLARLNPELARLNPELARLNPELARLNPELTRLNPELARLNPELARLNPEMVRLNPELARLNPELARINAEIGHLQMYASEVNDINRMQAEMHIPPEARFNTLRGHLVPYRSCQRSLGMSAGNLHRDCRMEENITIECLHSKSGSKGKIYIFLLYFFSILIVNRLRSSMVERSVRSASERESYATIVEVSHWMGDQNLLCFGRHVKLSRLHLQSLSSSFKEG